MSEWKPIETYDGLRIKPKHAVFLFKEELGRDGKVNLGRIIELVRFYGSRTCTHWMPLPEPPKVQP